MSDWERVAGPANDIDGFEKERPTTRTDRPRSSNTPVAGVGDSGVGREGGDFSREFFTEPKAIVMQIQR